MDLAEMVRLVTAACGEKYLAKRLKIPYQVKLTRSEIQELLALKLSSILFFCFYVVVILFSFLYFLLLAFVCYNITYLIIML